MTLKYQEDSIGWAKSLLSTKTLLLATCSGPLPEDLFSGLDDVSVSVNPAADPFQIAPPSTSTAATQPNPSTGIANVAVEKSAAEPAPTPGSRLQVRQQN